MNNPTLDPKDYDLDFPSKNKTDSIINFHRWGIPFEVQFLIAKDAVKRQNDQFEFFKEVYQETKVKKQDPRFSPFKAFLSKCLRGTSFENLTDAQIAEVVDLGTCKRPIDIARSLFPEEGFEAESRGRLNKIALTVKELIEAFGLEYEGERGSYNEVVISENDYRAPETEDQLLNKIKKYVPESGFVKTNLDAHQRKCLRFLKAAISSTRFLKTINSIRDVLSRKMFEEEFIKSIYDKPDLIAEDINGYIDLCQEFVSLANINDRINTLDNDFRNSTQGDDKTGAAAQARVIISQEMSSAQKQFNDSKARIASLSKTLAGARKERLDKEGAKENSLWKFVVKLTDQESRQRLVEASKAYANNILKPEIDKITKADQENVGEAHGISVSEILGFSYTPVD